MIYTSYYANGKGFNNFIKMSISLSIPARFAVDYQIREFMPTWELLNDYKTRKIDEAEYYKKYIALLNSRNLEPIVKGLQNLDKDVVLLCWEKPGNFCHRHLLAKYLNDKFKLGITEL